MKKKHVYVVEKLIIHVESIQPALLKILTGNRRISSVYMYHTSGLNDMYNV